MLKYCAVNTQSGTPLVHCFMTNDDRKEWVGADPVHRRRITNAERMRMERHVERDTSKYENAFGLS